MGKRLFLILLFFMENEEKMLDEFAITTEGRCSLKKIWFQDPMNKKKRFGPPPGKWRRICTSRPG